MFEKYLLLEEPQNPCIKKSICGLEYHFIKREILNFQKAVILDIPQKVLLTMGGSDNKELTISLMGMLNESLSAFNFTVLLGTCSQRIGFTEKRLLGISDDININRNARKVEYLYSSFDLALCKGGVTAFELMYLGVPLLLVSTYESQKEMLQLLAKKEAIVYVGHWNEITKEKINSHIQRITSSFEKRKRLSDNSKLIIDGKGTARIVDAIINI